MPKPTTFPDCFWDLPFAKFQSEVYENLALGIGTGTLTAAVRTLVGCLTNLVEPREASWKHSFRGDKPAGRSQDKRGPQAHLAEGSQNPTPNARAASQKEMQQPRNHRSACRHKPSRPMRREHVARSKRKKDLLFATLAGIVETARSIWSRNPTLANAGFAVQSNFGASQHQSQVLRASLRFGRARPGAPASPCWVGGIAGWWNRMRSSGIGDSGEVWDGELSS